MPYKDKEASREAARERQRRHRQGVTGQGVTGQGVTGHPSAGRIEVDSRTAAKLLMIGRSLDKPYKALDGKTGKLSDLVRYGVNGPTMSEVNAILSI